MIFDNLATVFGCSIVTDSTTDFSTVSSSWVTIFDCAIGFNKLETVLGCLTLTAFMSALFWFFIVFDTLGIFDLCFLTWFTFCFYTRILQLHDFTITFTILHLQRDLHLQYIRWFTIQTCFWIVWNLFFHFWLLTRQFHWIAAWNCRMI